MSDLKYQSVEQLEKSRRECERYIQKLRVQLEGQKIRLEWIDKYLYEKTPQEMTFSEIERKLGHKIIMKPEEK